MSVEVALQTLKLQDEFMKSVELIENVYADSLEDRRYSFITEGSSARLISGVEDHGHAWHGNFNVSQVAPVTEVLEDFLGSKPNRIKVEDYVLGLYMHDKSRDADIVTALGKFLKEGRSNG